MKTLIFIIILQLGTLVLNFKVLEIYKQESINELNTNKELVKLMNDLAIEREHALQDALEERIGTLERDVEDLKFILGERRGKH